MESRDQSKGGVDSSSQETVPDTSTAVKSSAMTETSSKPELMDDDTLLNVWVLCRRPPKKNAQPSTSNRLDSTLPSRDTWPSWQYGSNRIQKPGSVGDGNEAVAGHPLQYYSDSGCSRLRTPHVRDTSQQRAGYAFVWEHQYTVSSCLSSLPESGSVGNGRGTADKHESLIHTWTTRKRPPRRANTATISSVAFPNVAFRRPPTAPRAHNTLHCTNDGSSGRRDGKQPQQ